MRKYSSPAAFKTALEQRIRTAARQQQQDMNRIRQVLIFERLAVRLTAAFAADEIVVKGGLALELRLGRARSTRDIDLRAQGEPDGVISRIRQAGRLEMPDFLSFEIGNTASPLDGEGLVYEGLRLRATASLAGKTYGAPFGIDVAFGDVLTSSPETVDGSSLLAFAGIEAPRFLIYPRVTHIAEKVHAYTALRPTPNSRVKDLPDIGLLAAAGPLEAEALRRALDATFEFRASHPLPTELGTPPEQWKEPYARLAKVESLPWRDVNVLHAAVAAFLNPVLALEALGSWDPIRWIWHP